MPTDVHYMVKRMPSFGSLIKAYFLFQPDLSIKLIYTEIKSGGVEELCIKIA